MNDLIIGCATNYNWDKLKYWINSINSCGYQGEKVLILMNCDGDTVKKVYDSGFKIIGFNQDENNTLTYKSNLPVHVERFFHIYNILSEIDYRYVITTDVKDVIFQKNPIEFLENNLGNKTLAFSSESLYYRDEPWGKQNLHETFGEYFYNKFKNNEIYNVGVLAGRGYAMRDLAAMIFNMSINRPIPIVDQSTFNFMVSMEPYKSQCLYTKSEDGWACQLGTTADPTKIESFRPYLLEPEPTFNGDVVTTSTGKEYYIVHQYDRTEWNEKITKKFSD